MTPEHVLQEFRDAEALLDGRFEEVLPSYQPQPKDIYAVYPSRHSYDKRHEVVVAALLERIEALRRASLARRCPPTAIMA